MQWKVVVQILEGQRDLHCDWKIPVESAVSEYESQIRGIVTGKLNTDYIAFYGLRWKEKILVFRKLHWAH